MYKAKQLRDITKTGSIHLPNQVALEIDGARAPCLYRSQAFWRCKKGKGKVFPYSLPSVGPGADPGVQAVSPQVT